MATTCASPRPPVRSCSTRCARWSARWCMSARANGAPTISPRRSPPATAPPAARSRRRTGFIWCGWSIDSSRALPPPGLVEGGNGAKTPQIAERCEFVERDVAADARAALAQMTERLSQRLAGGEQTQHGEDGDPITDLLQRLFIYDRGASAFDHVGDQRPIETPADGAHLVDAFRTFDEQDIGAGFGIGVGAAQRLVQSERGARIGARDDEEVAV